MFSRLLVASVVATLVLTYPGIPVRSQSAEPCEARERDAYVPDAGAVAVYNFNIHKMDNAWNAWVCRIASSERPTPELLLIQDLEAREQGAFLRELGRVFGSSYRATYVENATRRLHLRRAVIWRASRFSLLRDRSVRGWGGQKGECEKGATNAGVVQARLKDAVATEAREETVRVSAATFKTPPPPPDRCAWRNTKLVAELFSDRGWTGDLLIFGADENTPDRDPPDATESIDWTCWYGGTNGAVDERGCRTPAGNDRNRGFADVVYELCTDPTDGFRPACLADKWTKVGRETYEDGSHVKKRIDFLFTKLGTGGRPMVRDVEVLPLGNSKCDTESANAGRGCYSDHRAVRAMIQYHS